MRVITNSIDKLYTYSPYACKCFAYVKLVHMRVHASIYIIINFNNIYIYILN